MVLLGRKDDEGTKARFPARTRTFAQPLNIHVEHLHLCPSIQNWIPRVGISVLSRNRASKRLGKGRQCWFEGSTASYAACCAGSSALSCIAKECHCPKEKLPTLPSDGLVRCVKKHQQLSSCTTAEEVGSTYS